MRNLVLLLLALGTASHGALPIISSFGGIGTNGIVFDSNGAIIIGGTTASSGLPTTPNAIQHDYHASMNCIAVGFPRLCNDAYVAKIASDGTLLYATYIGGNSDDAVTGVAADENGSIFVLGVTSSSDFPFTSPPNNSPAPFLLKIAADGALAFALRLPAGLNAKQIRYGGSGEIVLGGACTAKSIPWTATFYTSSAPSQSGACYVRLAPNGTDIVAATILAGPLDAEASDIALDAAGNAYLTGESFPRNSFPTTATSWIATQPQRFYDSSLFAAAVSRDGTTLMGSAVFNGENYEAESRIAVNASGEVLVVGSTQSSLFPVTPGAFQAQRLGEIFSSNLFVLKLKPDFSAPVYSTYLTGEYDDYLNAMVLNDDGTATLIGQTSSTLFPTTANAADRCLYENYYPSTQAFLTQVAPDGQSLLYSSFLNQGAGGGGANAGAFRNNMWALAMGGSIALLDTSQPIPPPRFCAMNAADFVGSGITAGETLTVFGSGLAGAEILFDGQPGAVLYSSDGQVNVVVPDTVKSGSNVQIQGMSQGQVIGTTTMTAVDYVAGLFRAFGTPTIVANLDDGTLVDVMHPAQPGSIVRIYGTGFGNTRPQIRAGGIIAAPVSEVQGDGVVEFRIVVPAPPAGSSQVSVDFTINGIFFQSTGLYLPVAVGR